MLKTRKFLNNNHFYNLRNVYTFRPHQDSKTGSNDRSHPKKSYSENELKKIRNIGIMAHIDAGKTTTTERMLFYSGFSKTVGEVHDGDTVMDYMEQERARGITITSAAITFTWKEFQFNLVDTPGHVDFTIEVERALSVLDGAVAIFDASAGVEAQSMTVWHQSDRYAVPRICYLNKMDKPTANLPMCLSSMGKKLSAFPLLIQLPLISGKNFEGVVDLVTMEKYIWHKENYGMQYEKCKVSKDSEKDLYNDCFEARNKLSESLADFDDELASYILDNNLTENVPAPLIASALRRVTLQQKAFPVLMGSSYRNTGVQLLMNAIIDYLPSPDERFHKNVSLYSPHLCAMVFKIVHNKQKGGLLCFIRIYSGNLHQNQKVYNVNHEKTEKVSKLMMAYADEFVNVSSASAGNIVVVSGLKNSITGDTLIESHSLFSEVKRQVSSEAGQEQSSTLLVGVKVPDPVFFCSVEVASLSQQKLLDEALELMQAEDPSLRVSVNSDTGETILSGMGELHLEIIQDRLQKEHKIDAELGPFQISYQEMISSLVQNTFEYNKVIGDVKQYVKLSLSVEPKLNYKFETLNLSRTRDNVENLNGISRFHLKALERGVKSALLSGPLLGCPVSSVDVHLHWFETEKGTSESFIAAMTTEAVRSLLSSASCHLMEPFMELDISCEEAYSPVVMADLSRRRASISQVSFRDNRKVINAECPLAEMVGYASSIRTVTSGTAVFSLQLLEYRVMLPQEQKKVIQKLTGFMS